jgi:hypothetical protein
LAIGEDVRIQELVELSERLGRLSRFDWARPFAAAGTLLLGGAVGALLTGAELDDRWVLVSVFVGAVCLVASLGVARERSESARAIKVDLDVMLATFEDQALIDALRGLYENASAVEANWLRRKLRAYLSRRRGERVA